VVTISVKFLRLLKKVVGSISQRYGSGDLDPHQNVTDPQHWIQYQGYNTESPGDYVNSPYIVSGLILSFFLAKM
jgi:hypothetical protein